MDVLWGPQGQTDLRDSRQRTFMDNKQTTMSLGTAYHCICSTLILTTNHKLENLARRQDTVLDRARILPFEGEDGGAQQSTLHNMTVDAKPIIIRRDDGFEKRLLYKCDRCKLTIGYKLDNSSSEEGANSTTDVLYILPGSLMDTETMSAGQRPTPPKWNLQQPS